MSRHAINLSAVFLKDIRQVWLLAAFAASAVLAHTAGVPVLSNGLHNAAVLVSGIFIIVLVQQDAPASLRHEWLTRPLAGLDVLLAKILLAVGTIALPAMLGSIILAVRHGSAIPEAALLEIAGMGPNLVGAFVLLLVAAVTSNLAQAAGLVAGLMTFGMYVLPAPVRVFWDRLVLIALAGGVIVLWLQYAQRRTNAARGVLGATVGIVGMVAALLIGSVDSI